MKCVLLFTIVFALLFSTVSMLFAADELEITSNDCGLHKGLEIGKGHELGQGIGHDNHGCDQTCPLCGGNPCVPPCPGV